MSLDPLSLVRELLAEAPLIDGHNDLPWQFRRRKKRAGDLDLSRSTGGGSDPWLTDIPRLRAGGVGGQFWAAYVPAELRGSAAVDYLFEQIDLIREFTAAYPEDLELALSAADIRRIQGQGKIASLIGIEGGHAINNSLEVLREACSRGARYLTLTHVKSNDWADAAGVEPKHGGLTPFGEEVVREMNRLGMMVDLSHVSDDTMRAALRVSRAPVIFSHSSARAVCNSPRNLPDDVLGLLRDNRGIAMACFLPGYLNESARLYYRELMTEKARLDGLYQGAPEQSERELLKWCGNHPQPDASVCDVADHVEHLCRVAGVEHVGIGSDFEGYIGTVRGLEDVSCYPALFEELLRRGRSTDDLRKIAATNLLRVFTDVERHARDSR